VVAALFQNYGAGQSAISEELFVADDAGSAQRVGLK